MTHKTALLIFLRPEQIALTAHIPLLLRGWVGGWVISQQAVPCCQVEIQNDCEALKGQYPYMYWVICHGLVIPENASCLAGHFHQITHTQSI